MTFDRPPDVIWLQYHGDGDADDDMPVHSDGVTWCWHRIFEQDINYVNASALRRTCANMRLAASHLEHEEGSKNRLMAFALELERLAEFRPEPQSESTKE